MNSNSRLLTNDELRELTGYSTPSKQRQALSESGIFFITRKDGRPSTTWGHIENPLTARKTMSASEQEPDFGAM